MNAPKSHNLFQRGKVQASVSSLMLEAKRLKKINKQNNNNNKKNKLKGIENPIFLHLHFHYFGDWGSPSQNSFKTGL